MQRWLGVVFFCVWGCVPTLDVPERAQVACTRDAECPDDFSCFSGRCEPRGTNARPTVEIVAAPATDVASRTATTLSFSAAFRDRESDSVTLTAELLNDGVATSATLAPTQLDLTNGTLTTTLTWTSDQPTSTYNADLTLRLTPTDGGGAGPTADVRVAYGNDAPEIESVTLDDDEVRGTSVLRLRMSDSASDPITIVSVELVPADSPETPITIPVDPTNFSAGSTGGIASAPVAQEHFVVWDSAVSAPFTLENAVLRVVVSDGHLDSVAVESSSFALANQTPPWVGTIRSPSIEMDTGTGIVLLTYELFDDQSDLVDVRIEFSTDLGVSWLPCAEYPAPASDGQRRLVTRPGNQGGVTHTFLWEPLSDVFLPANSTFIRITPAESASHTLGRDATVQLPGAASPLAESPPFASPAPLAQAVAVSMAVADLNQDGVQDIVLDDGPFAFANGQDRWFLLTGEVVDGTWQVASSVSTDETKPTGLGIADFDRDGTLDVAFVSSTAPGEAVVYLGGVASSVWTGEREGFTLGGVAGDSAVGDMNDDGVPDLVVAEANPNRIAVLLGSGSATENDWTLTRQAFEVGVQPRSVTVGFIDDDGLLDAITTNPFSQDVYIAYGEGSGETWSMTVEEYEWCGVPTKAALGDMDGDGHIDVVMGCRDLGEGQVLVYRGAGDRTFAEADVYAGGTSSVNAVAVRDMNLDGKLDVMVAGDDGHYLLLGGAPPSDPTHYLQPARALGVSATSSVVVAHVDGDAAPDILLSFASVGSDRQARIQLSGASSTMANALGPRIDVPVYLPLHQASLGDIDFDGRWDFVGGSAAGANTFTVHRGTSLLAPGLPFDGGRVSSFNDRIVCSSLVDLDGDAQLDLIGAGMARTGIRFGNGQDGVGDATFASSGRVFNDTDSSTDIAVGDLDGDGDQDFVLTFYGGFIVALNDGAGAFTTPDPFETPFSPEFDVPAVELADLDSDGVLDLILGVVDGDHHLTVAFGLGDGSFATPLRDWPAPNVSGIAMLSDVVVGDTNGDAKLDVVSIHDQFVQILHTRGSAEGEDWALELVQDFSRNDAVFASGSLSDVDGDGIQDLLLVDSFGSQLFVYRGLSDNGAPLGTFDESSPGVWATNSLPDTLSFADLNGDGVRDVVLANGGSAKVSIFPGRRLDARSVWSLPLRNETGPVATFGFNLPESDPTALGDELSVRLVVRAWTGTGASGPEDPRRPTTGNFVQLLGQSELLPSLDAAALVALSPAYEVAGIKRHARVLDPAGDGFRTAVVNGLGAHVAPDSLERTGLDLSEGRGVIVEIPIARERLENELQSASAVVRVFARTRDWLRASAVASDPLSGSPAASSVVPKLARDATTDAVLSPRDAWFELSASEGPTFQADEQTTPRFEVDVARGVLRLLIEQDGVYQGFVAVP